MRTLLDIAALDIYNVRKETNVIVAISDYKHFWKWEQLHTNTGSDQRTNISDTHVRSYSVALFSRRGGARALVLGRAADYYEPKMPKF